MSGKMRESAKKPSSRNAETVPPKQRGQEHAPDTPLRTVLSLHRTLGNRAVKRLLDSAAVQAKLTVGRPDDVYEQEADRVADRVMRMPEPQLRRKCAQCEEEPLQTKPIGKGITPLLQRQTDSEEEEPVQAKREGTTPVLSPGIVSGIDALRGGQPLSRESRAFFEPRFGRDFSGVKIHTGPRAGQLARSINARAFTRGRDIVFGSGEYSPASPDGKRLLGHELTHVLQQNSRHSVTPALQRKVRVVSGTGIHQIIGHFQTLCPGSWSSAGQFIRGNARTVANQSCTCIEDTVNDPNRTYRIQVDHVTNTPRSNQSLYNGHVEPSLPYPSSGPRTTPGSSPIVYMPAAGASAMTFGSFDPGGSAVQAPYWRILAHELCGHARLNQGYTGTKGNRPEHDSTINTENRIAAEHGGPPRGMFNDRRQGESYHCLQGDTNLVFALVDGWHYESSTAVQSPPITTGPLQGTVSASSLRIRQGPGTSTPIVGSYPRGTVIDLLCQTPGTEVGNNSLWDRTGLGYVSDRYVRRPPGYSRTKLPTCDPVPRPAGGVTYGRIATAVSRLRIRRGPDTAAPVVGSYGRGEMVSIICQTGGSDVNGTPVWDRTDRGYISDRYVERLPPGRSVPSCTP